MDVLRDTSPRKRDSNGLSTHASQPLPSISNMRKLINDMTTRFEQTNLDDADFQQLQTEFLEFTEYMPSEMDRCEQVIEEFEKKAQIAEHEYDRIAAGFNADGHDQSNTIISPGVGQVEEYLSARIKWLRCLGVCETERTRVLRNNKAWLARLAAIGDKLRDIRESLVINQTASENAIMSSSPAPTRTASSNKKRTDLVKEESSPGQRQAIPDATEKKANARRNGFWQNARRRKIIVVPGDIMPPGFLDLDQYSSDDSSEDNETYAPPPKTTGRIKVILKTSEPQKIRIPKIIKPREVDPNSATTHNNTTTPSMTNVISKLAPPPVDAQPGSIHAPWLQLTEYELALLRKRMKKNSVWSPSATMLNRELTDRGRGIVAYRAARSRAEAAGETLNASYTTVPRVNDETVSLPQVQEDDVASTPPTVNKGMKLNDLKKEKLKREAQQKEAAMAAEEMSGGLKTMLSRGLSNSFLAQPSNNKSSTQANGKVVRDKSVETRTEKDKETPNKCTTVSSIKPDTQIKKITLANGKRKRDSTVETVEAESLHTPGHSAKRPKVETPVPAPRVAGLRSHRTEATVPATATTPATSEIPKVGADTHSNTVTTTVPLAPSSARESSTPILPPIKDRKDKLATSIVHESIDRATPGTGRSTRAQSAKAIATPPPVATPPPPTIILKTSNRRGASRVKGETVEDDTPNGRTSRLNSNAPNTPVPDSAPARPLPRRATKRQPPGTVTIAPDTTETVKTSRTNATRKRARPKKAAAAPQIPEEEQIEMVEVDDQGNVIDPNEERFCICNRVSFGVMVACENEQCETEWFHLECVGLEKEPGRTKLWFCPTCRITLGMGETTNGEVSASVVARYKSRK